MSFAVSMNPIAAPWPSTVSVSFGDEEDEVEPKYNLSSVDPLALMIWWRADETTWGSDTYPPDSNVMVQRLQTIATFGADAVDKLLPGLVKGLPQEHRDEAQRAREYYINKFVQMGIKNEEPISQVRRAMYNVLTNTTELVTQDLALLSRIHDFYVEDQFVEKLVETAVSIDTSGIYIYNRVDQVYTVVGSRRRITRRAKINTWWMQGEDKTLLMLTSPLNSTTNSIVDQMLPVGARWRITCDACAIRSVMGHREFNTRVLTHGYKLSEAPDSA